MSFENLPSNHFLTQPRPDPFQQLQSGFVDTTTLAAHDFDVDNRTGFMPPQPLSHLAERVEKMDAAQMLMETGKSRSWRNIVAQMPLLPIGELKRSERALRRAHHVLAWLLHFYVHTIPSHEPIIIPRHLTIPLLEVSTQLQLPPVITYSDDVLYNWAHKEARNGSHYYNDIPTIDNLRCQTTFTGTPDEEEFYLTSARIELRGNEALELMRMSMDEAFVGDDIAIRRITGYLERMAVVIRELRDLLMSVKEGVEPKVFYNEIRPWFRGVDSDPSGRQWTFEGRGEVEGWLEMPEASGASAGQSSLIQALDIYLGVDAEAPETSFMSHPSQKSFQERMRSYMPRHHRSFLAHLRANPRPLRDLVQRAADEEGGTTILEAYNAALKSLKEFRDAHMIIVALYIIGPARHARSGSRNFGLVVSGTEEPPTNAQENQMMEKAFKVSEKSEALKGTGGTDLVKFLKGVRDQTADTYLRG
ncbi:hypothetical protein NP233_g4732 [Leucocoprinus birnbaumii]|uniref:Indoleamine 2,3-dioxygenase n=1 Tax=Leucocoprinus birnbaumii TaxID=56174 RepID=A0AAD5YXA9_9AGAR|nr:hypothetical protein NP233_g4732 [Leucocoprinus birnbaumii]